MNDSRRMALSVWVAATLALAALFSAAPASAESWRRIAKTGLDGPYNPLQSGIGATCVFNNRLYVGTGGDWGSGAGQIWRYDGTTWVLVYKPIVGRLNLRSVSGLAVLGNYLYAGFRLNSGGCEVWRTSGTGAPPHKWTKVSSSSNIGNSKSQELSSMVVSGGSLYVGIGSYWGCQVWKYTGSSWSQFVGQGPAGSPMGPGFGNQENYDAPAMAVSPEGDLYVGTSRSKGAEVWRWDGAGWAKLNQPGFNKQGNYSINALEIFASNLYAAVSNYSTGCQIWKYVGPKPSNWKPITLNGFGDAESTQINAAAVFGTPGYLYLLVENYNKGCRVIRTNGKTWEQVNTNGFGEADTWDGSLEIFDGNLYAGVSGTSGLLVFATAGGPSIPHDWSLKNEPGFTENDNEHVGASVIFQGRLHIGTYNGRGCQVWRYEANGWTQLATGGFGDPGTSYVECMAADNAFLYAGANNDKGCQVWRYDGASWTRINSDGFGDPETSRAASMIIFRGKLYVGTGSYQTRGRVWRFDGPGPSNWTKVNKDGFGISHTVSVEAMVIFNNKLYAGTYDSNDPCRAWRYDGPGPPEKRPGIGKIPGRQTGLEIRFNSLYDIPLNKGRGHGP